MKHTQIVGIPVEEDGEVVDYKDACEIASNEYFKYRKRGYIVIPPEYIAKMREEEEAAAAAAEDEPLNLGKMKVAELKALAIELGVAEEDLKGLKKDEIVAKIQEVQAEAAEE